VTKTGLGVCVATIAEEVDVYLGDLEFFCDIEEAEEVVDV